MNRQTHAYGKLHARRTPGRPTAERGVALLITLGLLALLGAASLAVIFLTSSDTMINGYYRNYRASFYAADSGVNVVVEAMKNAIANSANPGAAGAPLPIVGGNPAVPSNGTATAPAALAAALAPYLGSDYTIGDNGSWNSQFKLVSVNAVGAPTFQVTCRTGDGACPGDGDYAWTFNYPYSIVVAGQSEGNEAEQITENFVISYSSSPGSNAGGGLPTFARWAGFIDQFALCQGALVPGNMYGPFFTNGSWNFGNFTSPGYTFENSIGQAGSQVGYFTNRGCQAGGAVPPAGFTPPKFVQGFNIGASPITTPTDSYNQQEAVLDGKGAAPCTANPCGNGSRTPPTALLMSTMQMANGTSYPLSGSAPTGVYFPTYTNSSGQLAFGSDPAKGGDGAGGGFYVNGNASVVLSATTDSAHNATQTYTITQGATTTTIVVDVMTNTTTVKSGSSNLTLQGVPSQVDPNTGQPMLQNDPSGNPVAPTMVYVNGQVTGLSGTVQNNTGVTVTATSNVSITGDLTYVQQPVTSSDALVSNTNAGVLGIYTPGNINLYPDSSGNLTINASLAMIGGGTSGLATPGRGINTLTIMGGRSEDQAHGVNIGSGNTLYDQRFAGNFGPPWFPTAQPQPGAPAIPQFQGASVSRLSWQDTNR
jgi:hypothetical protein